VTRHRLPALALIVAALVAIVAVVAHGRPLGASAGHGGLPSSFWDYVVTSGIILVVLVCAAVLAATLTTKPETVRPRPSHLQWFLRSLVGIIGFGLSIAIAWRYIHLSRSFQPPSSGGGQPPNLDLRKPVKGATSPHFVWAELAFVVGVLVLVGAVYLWTRPKRRPWEGFRTAPEAVAAALDESLDDLRSDPDLRRAIVAAYARMEKALAAAGLPRRPAEAPLEYVERALLSLDTSGASVRRLTDLFEWARFSQHEPEPSMRDEAVDALEAVRDELRAPVQVAA
jgi:hypothetical protein